MNNLKELKNNLHTVLTFIMTVKKWATTYSLTTIAVSAQEAQSAFECILSFLEEEL
jgi:hypothetical protein